MMNRDGWILEGYQEDKNKKREYYTLLLGNLENGVLLEYTKTEYYKLNSNKIEFTGVYASYFSDRIRVSQNIKIKKSSTEEEVRKRLVECSYNKYRAILDGYKEVSNRYGYDFMGGDK